MALAELSKSVDAPLSSIAKKASVGQGTFYRNFPNREALVMEVYRHEVQVLTDGAADLLRTRPPEQALRVWMDQLARFAVAKIGLGTVMRQIVGSSDGPAQPGYALVVQAVESMLAANHHAGTIRPDVTADDFILAIAGIWQLDAGGEGQAQAARVLDIVMNGLIAGAPARQQDSRCWGGWPQARTPSGSLWARNTCAMPRTWTIPLPFLVSRNEKGIVKAGARVGLG